MDDALYGTRDKRGDWAPAKLIEYPPVLVWPAQPARFLKWLFGYPGYILPWNLAYAAFAVLLWLYLTPICYAETQVPAAAAGLLSINPMWALVRGYRSIFLESRAPDAMSLAALGVGSLVVALAGYAWFHRLRRSFADTI